MRGRKKSRIVIGIHAVTEALKVSEVESIWLRQGFKDSQVLKKIETMARQKKIVVTEKAMGQLNQLAESHQGVAAFVTSQPEFDWSMTDATSTCCLVGLDQVEDPHNLGAVLRTSWLLGVAGVFVPENRSSSLSPAASKVAQGGSEHVPLIHDSLPANLSEARERGFWIYGLSHESSKSIYSLSLPPKVFWVLGSESSGIRKTVASVCDELVHIPQTQADASFNVSVAAAMALGETFRQHQILENSGK